MRVLCFFFFFFFNDTATTEIYTLSLHDALPISGRRSTPARLPGAEDRCRRAPRSEEHTSELQSHLNLVCRLLLEKKKNTSYDNIKELREACTVHGVHKTFSII